MGRIIVNAIVIFGCVSSTIALKDISSETTGWIFTKLARNEPYMTIFSKLFKWLRSVLYLGHTG